MIAIYQHFGLAYPTGSYLQRIQEIDSTILANEIPVLIPKLDCIISKDRNPYEIAIDLEERSMNDVKEEYEDTVNYLIKKL